MLPTFTNFQDELLHPQPCGGRPVRGPHLRPDRHHLEDHHLVGGGGRGLQVSLSIFFLKKESKNRKYTYKIEEDKIYLLAGYTLSLLQQQHISLSSLNGFLEQ